MDHIKRIQRAIDYIEEHLKEDELSTKSIAEVACYSMWHFQRVFSSIVGDSVKEYIRKRRLASALIELNSTGRRILDIAIGHQFESQESFARAFKAHFGRTPGECRNEGAQSLLALTKPRVTIEYLDHLYGGMTMKPKFLQVAEKQIVGVGGRMYSAISPKNNSQEVASSLWGNFKTRIGEVKSRVDSRSIGFCESTSGSFEAHPEEYFYVAGTEVEDTSQIPEGMVTKTIPAGRYAVFTHKGRVDKIEHSMRYIFGSWLPKSGEELRDAPEFSVIEPGFDPNSEDSEFDIYIPVKSQADA